MNYDGSDAGAAGRYGLPSVQREAPGTPDFTEYAYAETRGEENGAYAASEGKKMERTQNFWLRRAEPTDGHGNFYLCGHPLR